MYVRICTTRCEPSDIPCLKVLEYPLYKEWNQLTPVEIYVSWPYKRMSTIYTLQEKQPSDFSHITAEFSRFSDGQKLIALLDVLLSLSQDSGTKIKHFSESAFIVSCFFLLFFTVSAHVYYWYCWRHLSSLNWHCKHNAFFANGKISEKKSEKDGWDGWRR